MERKFGHWELPIPAKQQVQNQVIDELSTVRVKVADLSDFYRILELTRKGFSVEVTK